MTRPLRRSALRARPLRVRPGAGFGDALPQPLHQVHGVALLLAARRLPDGELAFGGEELLEGLTILVRVPGGVPFLRREVVDQEAGHLDLGGLLARSGNGQGARVPQFVEGTKHLERESPFSREERREEGFRAEVKPCDSDAARVVQRVAQDAVGFLASLHRGEVVRLLEREGIQRPELDELKDVDAAVSFAELLLDFLELLLLDDSIFVLLDLVSLHDLVVRDLHVFYAAEFLVFDGRHVLAVEKAERDALGLLDRRVDSDGDGNQSEGDVTAPESSHAVSFDLSVEQWSCHFPERGPGGIIPALLLGGDNPVPACNEGDVRCRTKTTWKTTRTNRIRTSEARAGARAAARVKARAAS